MTPVQRLCFQKLVKPGVEREGGWRDTVTHLRKFLEWGTEMTPKDEMT